MGPFAGGRPGPGGAGTVSGKYPEPVAPRWFCGKPARLKRRFPAGTPDRLHIAEIVRFMDGDIYSVDQHQAGMQAVDTVFAALWQQAQAAIEQVYQEKTLQDLLDAQAMQQAVSDYAI